MKRKRSARIHHGHEQDNPTRRCRGAAIVGSRYLLHGGKQCGAGPSPDIRWSAPVESDCLTGNNTKLVNVNPEANSVSVFDVTSEPATKLAEITVGADPSSVAAHPNDTKTYVANAFSGSSSVVN